MSQVFGLVGIVLCILGVGVGIAFFLHDRQYRRKVNSLRARRLNNSDPSGAINELYDWKDAEAEQIAEEPLKQKPTREESLARLLYQAGCFSQAQQRSFHRMRIWAPAVGLCLGFFITSILDNFGSPLGILLITVLTLLGGRLPYMRLESMTKARTEETLFFLPIVIEQLVIGVSSSLEVGPCIQKILELSRERDKTNPVLDLVEQALFRLRSGRSLDDALIDVGTLAGVPQVRHAFNAIAQVSRHGGEVTRQLQELADAVSNEREIAVEAVIKKLELKATLPVALAFLAFMATLFAGVGASMMSQSV